MTDWATLPKVELHLHLEGAMPPRLALDLAAEKGIDLRGVVDPEGYRYEGFAGFLRCYEAACAGLKGPGDYARLTTAVCEDLAANGVVYAEVFTTPALAAGNDRARWHEVTQAVREAAEAVRGPDLRQIVTCVRHFGPDSARAAALCAQDTAGDGFTSGFGMGGAEDVGRQGDYAWAFDAAREAGLGLTTHAGEWRGPAEIRDALALGITRIGHGIRAVEDPALCDVLAERGIVLEVCPGSNVALGASGPLERHPIEALRARDVPVTVSTDDPPFFRTTMAREWQGLERAFGWGPEDLTALNEVALGAAFCDEPTRRRIAKRLEAG